MRNLHTDHDADNMTMMTMTILAHLMVFGLICVRALCLAILTCRFGRGCTCTTRCVSLCVSSNRRHVTSDDLPTNKHAHNYE